MRSNYAVVSHQPEVQTHAQPSPIEEWLWADVFESVWTDEPAEQLRNTLLYGD